MENLFDALCSALSEAPIKKLFLDAEGPDLMVLMMKYILYISLNTTTLTLKTQRKDAVPFAVY
jgi:hypothetical protein